MLVGPCRDFTCPHCGALYKLVRVPKFESNRLDYDRIPCVQCSRVLSPDVFMTKNSFAEPEPKDEPRRIATNISKLPEQKRGRRSGLHIVNIPSRSAALHRCPMDHSDTAYRRRPEQSNLAGSRSLRRSNRNSDDDGAGRRRPRMPRPGSR